jgi:uncharacterized protein YqcC (DUF446 family)
MKNLALHTDLLCELETSLLMKGFQIGEMSKLGWLQWRLIAKISGVLLQKIFNLCFKML